MNIFTCHIPCIRHPHPKHLFNSQLKLPVCYGEEILFLCSGGRWQGWGYDPRCESHIELKSVSLRIFQNIYKTNDYPMNFFTKHKKIGDVWLADFFHQNFKTLWAGLDFHQDFCLF
jgi:hypothetical protein